MWLWLLGKYIHKLSVVIQWGRDNFSDGIKIRTFCTNSRERMSLQFLAEEIIKENAKLFLDTQSVFAFTSNIIFCRHSWMWHFSEEKRSTRCRSESREDENIWRWSKRMTIMIYDDEDIRNSYETWGNMILTISLHDPKRVQIVDPLSLCPAPEDISMNDLITSTSSRQLLKQHQRERIMFQKRHEWIKTRVDDLNDFSRLSLSPSHFLFQVMLMWMRIFLQRNETKEMRFYFWWDLVMQEIISSQLKWYISYDKDHHQHRSLSVVSFTHLSESLVGSPKERKKPVNAQRWEGDSIELNVMFLFFCRLPLPTSEARVADFSWPLVFSIITYPSSFISHNLLWLLTGNQHLNSTSLSPSLSTRHNLTWKARKS